MNLSLDGIITLKTLSFQRGNLPWTRNTAYSAMLRASSTAA